MNKIKIGILREGKVPPDRRVALLPDQCLEIMKSYPHVSIVVQPSDIRCITNKEYSEVGIALQEDLSDCDILMGIKEVPIHQLIANKTYTFFSHTLKKQPHNQKLLQTVLEKNISLIDYECLENPEGIRILAFGRFAGIVGSYNAFMIYGKRNGLYDLKRAYQCFDFNEMKQELMKVKLPPIKIILTGGGRVAKGAEEILDLVGVEKVRPKDLLENEYDVPVYAQVHSEDFHKEKTGKPFEKESFYISPENYTSYFNQYAQKADMLIAGAFWDPKAPVLFTLKDVKSDDFKLRIIADITCDIKGSIPTTVKTSTILEPVYDFNRQTFDLEAPYSHPDNVTEMAVDNLPGELPRDSSRDFGRQLIFNVLPHLLNEDKLRIIEKATIARNKSLMPDFQYLSDYVQA